MRQSMRSQKFLLWLLNDIISNFHISRQLCCQPSPSVYWLMASCRSHTRWCCRVLVQGEKILLCFYCLNMPVQFVRYLLITLLTITNWHTLLVNTICICPSDYLLHQNYFTWCRFFRDPANISVPTMIIIICVHIVLTKDLNFVKGVLIWVILWSYHG